MSTDTPYKIVFFNAFSITQKSFGAVMAVTMKNTTGIWHHVIWLNFGKLLPDDVTSHRAVFFKHGHIQYKTQLNNYNCHFHHNLKLLCTSQILLLETFLEFTFFYAVHNYKIHKCTLTEAKFCYSNNKRISLPLVIQPEGTTTTKSCESSVSTGIGQGLDGQG